MVLPIVVKKGQKEKSNQHCNGCIMDFQKIWLNERFVEK